MVNELKKKLKIISIIIISKLKLLPILVLIKVLTFKLKYHFIYYSYN